MSSGSDSSPAPSSSATPERPVPSTTSTSWWSVPMRRASSRALRAARSAGSCMGGRLGGSGPSATYHGLDVDHGRPRPTVAAPAVAPERGRDQSRPPDRLRQWSGRRGERGAALRLRRPVRSTKGRGAGDRPGRAGRASTARCAWCSCRARRPTWSRRPSRSPGARSCAGRPSRTSARRCRWRRPTRPSWHCRNVPNGTPPSTARGIADRSLVQVDPWPAGTFGLDHEKGRRITRASPTCAASADDNGYARPIEGLLGLRRHGARRGARGARLRRGPDPADVGQLLPRAQRAAAHRSEAAGDHPARGPELRGGRQPRALAEVVAARRHGPAGGAGPLRPSATRTAAVCGRSSTGPR